MAKNKTTKRNANVKVPKDIQKAVLTSSQGRGDTFKDFMKSPDKKSAAAKRKAAVTLSTARSGNASTGGKIMRSGGAGSGLIRGKLKGQF